MRPAEDIEEKVSSLFSKISHPVLANLKLTAGNDVRLDEIYPPQLPDLFHGGQLVVLGRTPVTATPSPYPLPLPRGGEGRVRGSRSR